MQPWSSQGFNRRHVPLTSADVGKARQFLNFRPQTTIAQGVPAYVEWFRKMRAAGVAVC